MGREYSVVTCVFNATHYIDSASKNARIKGAEMI